MEIHASTEQEERHWNDFVKKHYPPVGAFMQSFEWGEFQKSLGRSVVRYLVIEEGVTIAAFSLAYYTLPFSLQYAYSPRGPVFKSSIGIAKQWRIFQTIRSWVQKINPSYFLFDSSRQLFLIRNQKYQEVFIFRDTTFNQNIILPYRSMYLNQKF